MLALSRRSLADLPPPSLDIFAPRHPWCPIPARALAEALNFDHGLLGVWRMRGVGPKSLPAEWTKGRGNAYLITDALAWLADRRGETFDPIDAWRDCLQREFEIAPAAVASDVAVRGHAAFFARVDVSQQEDVKFTRTGFQAYLGSLLSK